MVAQKDKNGFTKFAEWLRGQPIGQQFEEEQAAEIQARRKAQTDEVARIQADLLADVRAREPKLGKARAAVEKAQEAVKKAQEAYRTLLYEDSHARHQADSRIARLERELRASAPPEVAGARAAISEMMEQFLRDSTFWPTQHVRIVRNGIRSSRTEPVVDLEKKREMNAALLELRQEAEGLELYGGADIREQAARIVERGRAVLERGREASSEEQRVVEEPGQAARA
ncbi:MAG: hypothetical protein L0177_06215 [Chloroflexi bacterium]|nr:hypothetical protein [Chloroflexota bacterium]